MTQTYGTIHIYASVLCPLTHSPCRNSAVRKVPDSDILEASGYGLRPLLPGYEETKMKRKMLKIRQVSPSGHLNTCHEAPRAQLVSGSVPGSPH